MRGSKRLWIIALMMVLALVAAACGGDDENGDTGDDATSDGESETYEAEAGTPMAEWQEEGSVTIGVKFDVPPFGFLNPQTDEVEGFDVDMGQYVADKLGVEVEFIEAISDNRIPFLADGTADLILSTMTITTDRDAEIEFSRPYWVASGRILVPGDSDIAGVEDLAGAKVCTAIGSTYEATLAEQAPEADLTLVDEYSQCFERIQNGSVDAVSTDDVILTGMIIQDESLMLTGEELTTEPYGIGMADGETELQAFLDETIEEAFDDGTWDEMAQRWVTDFTGEEPQDPREVSLEDAFELFPCVEAC